MKAFHLIYLLSSTHAGCLKQSEEIAGINGGFQISNLSDIESINEPGYHLHQIATCEDSSGALIGIQFILALHADETPKCPQDGDACFTSSESWSTVELTALGNLSGECQTLTLTG